MRCRYEWHSSLRAKRSNPEAACEGGEAALDCFVAGAPRNDAASLRRELAERAAVVVAGHQIVDDLVERRPVGLAVASDCAR